MQEFLATALSAPTLVFTILMGVVLLYWVTVMVGALDLDVLDPGGAAEGLDGAAEGAAEGIADAGDADVELGGIAGVLAALKLRYAPVTVTFSVLTLLCWLGTFFGSRHLAPLVPGGDWIAGLAVTAAAVALAVPLTSLSTRPLAPLFRTTGAKGNRDLIGSVVVVKTGTVDKKFGQAELNDGQAGLLLRVRCDDEDALARGDRALIVDWDEDAHAFAVEPMDAVLGDDEKKRRA